MMARISAFSLIILLLTTSYPSKCRASSTGYLAIDGETIDTRHGSAFLFNLTFGKLFGNYLGIGGILGGIPQESSNIKYPDKLSNGNSKFVDLFYLTPDITVFLLPKSKISCSISGDFGPGFLSSYQENNSGDFDSDAPAGKADFVLVAKTNIALHYNFDSDEQSTGRPSLFIGIGYLRIFRSNNNYFTSSSLSGFQFTFGITLYDTAKQL